MTCAQKLCKLKTEARNYCRTPTLTSVTPIYLRGLGVTCGCALFLSRHLCPPRGTGLFLSQGKSTYPSICSPGPCESLFFAFLLGNKILGQ